MSLLPLATGAAAAPVLCPAESAAEGLAEPLPALQRHRVLETGFRLKSKAFMLTFNNRVKANVRFDGPENLQGMVLRRW